MGNSKFVPTAEQRANVTMMKGFGLSNEEIALLVIDQRTGKAIGAKSLAITFKDELLKGTALVNMKVVESLFKTATGKTPQAVTAQIWWTKARMNWRSTERVEHEITGSSGVLVAPAMLSPEDWIRTQREKNSKRKPPKE